MTFLLWAWTPVRQRKVNVRRRAMLDLFFTMILLELINGHLGFIIVMGLCFFDAFVDVGDASAKGIDVKDG